VRRCVGIREIVTSAVRKTSPCIQLRLSSEEWEEHVNLSFTHTPSFLCRFCNCNAIAVALEYRRHSRRRVFTLVRPHLREKDCFLSQSDVFHLLILAVIVALDNTH
jgi:hypothetical protein